MFFSDLDDFIDKYSHPLANQHFWVTSIWKPLSIILVYILSIKKIGPWYMKKRKPYNVKNWIIAYNVLQIIVNSYLTVRGIQHVPLMKGSMFCLEVDNSNSEVAKNGILLAYYFYLMKILDIFDTIFYILKKNYHQVTFSHVYHHAMMIFAGWLGVKFAGGAHGAYIAAPNVFVHAVMYSYYLLSAYDPKYKENLTFKKYITLLQMMQFVFIAVMNVPALRPTCDYPNILAFLGTFQAAYMLYLFGNFYYKTYINMRIRKDRKE